MNLIDFCNDWLTFNFPVDIILVANNSSVFLFILHIHCICDMIWFSIILYHDMMVVCITFLFQCIGLFERILHNFLMVIEDFFSFFQYNVCEMLCWPHHYQNHIELCDASAWKNKKRKFCLEESIFIFISKRAVVRMVNIK